MKYDPPGSYVDGDFDLTVLPDRPRKFLFPSNPRKHGVTTVVEGPLR